MSNEGEKRKKNVRDDAVPGSQKKKAREVTDEEVEEFYTILRRINTAVKYFKSGGDRGGPSQGRWRASLEEEIMQEVKGKEGTLSLDLNVSPQEE